MSKSSIKPVYNKQNINTQKNDFAYWQSQPYQARLEALEEIRIEYHLWRYGAEPGFQRVYKIIKQQ